MAHASDVVSTPPQTPVTTTGAPYWAPSSAAPVQDLPAGLVSNGSLGIKERRSWATWQLVSIAFVALLGGMLVEYLASGSGGSSSASKVNAKSYTPPPPSRSSSSGTASPGGKTGSTTTTSTAPGAGAGQTTSTTAPVTGPAQVLLGPYQSQGDWTSPSFTIGGGQWNIGWAYRCTPAPAAGPLSRSSCSRQEEVPAVLRPSARPRIRASPSRPRRLLAASSFRCRCLRVASGW